MKTIAIANQKGGVGKTTISLALATAIADLVKKSVLIVDLDLQANATVGLGQHPEPGVARWLMMGDPLDMIAIPVRKRLDLMPSNLVTDDVNLALANRSSIDAIKRGLEAADYDYVIIDCPPSLSMITRAGLFASDLIITPIDCEYFALQGMVTLTAIIHQVQDDGSRAQWLGVIPNKYRQVNVHRRYIKLLQEKFGIYGDKFIWEPLPNTIQIAQTQTAGQTIWECPDVDKRHRAAWARMVKRVLDHA